MRRFGQVVAIGLLGIAAAIVAQPGEARAQASVCGRSEVIPTEDLGVPTAEGTARESQLAQVDDERAFRFIVSDPSTVYVYVGDQWYDLDLAVYSIDLNRAIACWQTTGARARSERAERRVLQLVRPDEQIVEGLQPGVYALLVGVDINQPAAVATFDPSRAFTIRVAAGPLTCDLDPNNLPHPLAATNPEYANVRYRSDDALYQLGMNYVPLLPSEFSLMSFNAVVSPPYTDLFDFTWFVNGRQLPDSGPTFQMPATQVAPGGRGTVRVVAKGAREYQDPDQPHIPLNGGTLSVECPVLLRT